MLRQAILAGGAPAILAPNRRPMSYQTLLDLVDSTELSLRSFGLSVGHRIAIVLPDGPEMASALLAVSCHNPCAPLNPRYRRPEFEFYFSDLRASAVLLPGTGVAEAEAAAHALRLPILRMNAIGDGPAGLFDLALEGTPAPVDTAETPPEDRVALLLHTSGTTSRPKLVPLRHRHLWTSAQNVARTLALGTADKCLNIMPLFHIHGIVACLLATLASGGAIVCTPGLLVDSFFDWMEETQPTWFSAVPAMHQAILRRAATQKRRPSVNRLRLVRSSSASLAPTVLGDLEQFFSVPVVEAYGMTEAAHQVTCNPLPPGERKPGSVGPQGDVKVAIAGEERTLLEPGRVGEVVISGDNVFDGYEGNEEANRAAFLEGGTRWFRTGDLGRFDEDGYLHLLGRIKEQINRGGEKISPREIDEVLMRHPAVAQAVAFSIPHPQLGEEVGAAVVLKTGAVAKERDLRAFAARELADFKVPRLIRLVEELPKGPTGKIRRIGMAEALGIGPEEISAPAEYLEARNQTEARLVSIWQQLLGREPVGVQDQFAASGGDSMLAIRMLAIVRERFGVESAFPAFILDGTIESLARELDDADTAGGPARMVRLSPAGKGTAMFCAPGHGSAVIGLARLARHLELEHCLYSAHYPGYLKASAVSVQQIGATFAEDLERIQPSGPLYLVGYCFGGLVALEAARVLREKGREPRLVLIDALHPRWRSTSTAGQYLAGLYQQFRVKVPYHLHALTKMKWRQSLSYVLDRTKALVEFHGEAGRAAVSVSTGTHISGELPMPVALRAASQVYRPAPYEGPVLLVRSLGRRPHVDRMGWRRLLLGPIEEADLPFHPYGALTGEVVGHLADLLRKYGVAR